MASKTPPNPNFKPSSENDINAHFETWKRKLRARLMNVRKANKLTHREFAWLFDSTTGTSIRWGVGRSVPELAVLLEMVRKFKLDPSEIFGD